MDFPQTLGPNWVYSIDEVKQSVELIIKNAVGSFLQDHILGTNISIHTDDPRMIEVSVQESLSRIKFIRVDSVRMVDNTLFIIITY